MLSTICSELLKQELLRLRKGTFKSWKSGWGYSSVIEYMLIMCKALGMSPSKALPKRMLGIYLQKGTICIDDASAYIM